LRSDDMCAMHSRSLPCSSDNAAWTHQKKKNEEREREEREKEERKRGERRERERERREGKRKRRGEGGREGGREGETLTGKQTHAHARATTAWTQVLSVWVCRRQSIRGKSDPNDLGNAPISRYPGPLMLACGAACAPIPVGVSKPRFPFR
jgi:hypothetical protein